MKIGVSQGLNRLERRHFWAYATTKFCGEGGIAFGDPGVGGFNQMNAGASAPPIFVFRIRIEQARPSAANKNAQAKPGAFI
jgi:hypothetical protein